MDSLSNVSITALLNVSDSLSLVTSLPIWENTGQLVSENTSDILNTFTSEPTTHSGNLTEVAWENSTHGSIEATPAPFVYNYGTIHPDEAASRNLWKYLSPIIMVVGILGNSMSVAVMLRKR